MIHHLLIMTSLLSAAITILPPLAPAQSNATEIPLEVVAADGIRLAGTLYTPVARQPHPVVILVHGSEAGGRHQPGYLRWSEALVAAGFAVLVWDKRGAGESGGEYVEAPPIMDPADDLLLWVNLLSDHPTIDRDAIGLLGWSQAGWVMPLAASRSRDVAFLVIISGSGVSPLEQNIYDKTNRVVARGLSPERATLARAAVRGAMSYLVTGENEAGAALAWSAVENESWFTDSYDGIPMMDRERLITDPRGIGFVRHNGYDPHPAMAALKVPVLALFGGNDRIVPVAASLEAMKRAIDKPGQLTHRIFEGGNHGLGVRGGDGRVTLHPEVRPMIIGWLRGVVGRD